MLTPGASREGDGGMVGRPRLEGRVGMLPWVLAIALVVAGVAGCATTGPGRVAQVEVDRPIAPPLPMDAADARVLATVSWVLTSELGLPLPWPLTAHFYGSQDAFVEGLVLRGGADAGSAREQARYATGVGTARGIFIRSDRLVAAPLVVRAGLFAHELAHVSQYELARGRRGGSEQWLREGFADWVRFRTLDALSLRPYAESRRRVIEEVRRAGPVGSLPALGVLVSNRQWTEARDGAGSPATYGQAFLATDWLVERCGHAAVVDYFRRFGDLDDRARNFHDAFGAAPGQFAEEFRARLPALL